MTKYASLSMALPALFMAAIPSAAFAPTALRQTPQEKFPFVLKSSMKDEINRELAEAKALLAQAQAQLEAMEAGEEVPTFEEEDDEEVPFFASGGGSSKSGSKKREILLKSTNEEGLITVNGEEMAKLSEEESWAAKPLNEVFKNELNENEDAYASASKQLADTDVAASIWNLRKSMQESDYKRIFDKRNRFIGEDV